MIYARDLAPPNSSFFLFGPRGTGKSTWLRYQYKNAYTIDLLPPDQVLKYQKDPLLFRAEVLAQSKNNWIVVDEVQRVPQLLDEVHFLMENYGYKKFVLTGSSAYKLKRGASNLLAGRAVLRSLYPLNANETHFSHNIDTAMEYGMLPMAVLTESNEQRRDYLTSSVETYLNEEVKYEGLVRNIGSFARFLEIATLSAATAVNVSSIAREAEIARDTVRGYFSVFEDTLLGSWLPAYRPRAKMKEVSKPKFYWFDPGVLNAAAGGFDQPKGPEWQGVLFEHLVHNEIKSFLDYSKSKGSLGFWGTPSSSEIDFVWWYGRKVVAIEAKSSKRFRKEDLKGFQSFAANHSLSSRYIVYRGEKEMKVDDTWILPAEKFFRRLHRGEILGA